LDTNGALTVIGTAPPGSTITVRDNGGPKATATTSGAGQWSAALSGLANGTHTVTTVATLAGTTSASSAPVVVLVDTVKPKVTATTPGAGATGISNTTNVKITLSEAVRATTVATSVFLVRAGTTTRLPATVTYDNTTKTVVLNPSNNLEAGKTYKATVATTVLDPAGNPLDQNPNLSGLQPKTCTSMTR
jgi:hypothetical protein